MCGDSPAWKDSRDAIANLTSCNSKRWARCGSSAISAIHPEWFEGDLHDGTMLRRQIIVNQQVELVRRGTIALSKENH
jgi:hypothetical protein